MGSIKRSASQKKLGRGGKRPVKSGLPTWMWLGLGGLALIILLAGTAIFALALFPRTGGAMAFGKGCVGVIELHGDIVPYTSPDSILSAGQTGADDIAQSIEDADSRGDVKAILLDVDSPGGSVYATREIYQAYASAKKPKVAYFRETAASGAYYIASASDYIVSDPDTLTGSIGVRATVADLSGLFAKIGYNETIVKSGELKDMGTASRPMSDQEREVFVSIVNETFEEFKGIVVANRGQKLDPAGFGTALDARVLSGRQAKAIGLVDALGSRKDALDKAALLAGEDGLPVCDMTPAGRNPLSRLLGEMIGPVIPAMESGAVHLSS